MTPLKRRCAVYTRKSSEEGLDQAFNSLDAQREACEAYVLSQRTEGWFLVPNRYDDGGFSGGNMDRPALKRLIADIEAGLVDIVAVYKIDRLSRSLMDFTRLVELFERRNVTFVSVTQSFNTTTSMGRLVLNILLSFGQFEREIAGERIRDKIAASRKKGLWMGGVVPLGYRVENRKLVIDPDGAEAINWIFQRFVQLRNGTAVLREVWDKGWRSRSGRRICKVMLHKILRNRVYIGEAVHKGVAYPGEHEGIIDRETWDQAHALLKVNPKARARASQARTPALLKGMIFGPTGVAMTPSHSRRDGRLYRYYVSMDANKRGDNSGELHRVPAGPVEQAVLDQVRRMMQAPEIIAGTDRALKAQGSTIGTATLRQLLHQFDDVWNELFPAEQSRIVGLLVERVDVTANGVRIRLKANGLGALARELLPAANTEKAA